MPARQIAEEAVAAGVRFFQYRNKKDNRSRIYVIARDLASLLKKTGALFVVNDHADIACAVGADGVHLGQDDLPMTYARRLLGPEKIIGISTHSEEQAVAAERDGADYIGFGPLFRTSTKDAGPEKGLDRLIAVRAATRIPIIAIGGISESTAGMAIGAGADGVAVISAVLGAANAADACRALITTIASEKT